MRARGLALAVALVLATRAHAQPIPAIEASGVDERPGSQLPLATPFVAAGGGGPVTLGTFVDGTRPVLLVLAYARCTMLCNLVLRGVIEVAKQLPLVAGRDYQLVLVGLDANETIDEAARKQAALLADLGRVDDRVRWPYLVGTRASIDAIAGALGFRYAWDARTEQYAHPAVIFALTPDGKVSRYLHGIQFAPGEVTAALTDAAAGKIVSTKASAILNCFRFDPAARGAGKRAEQVLQIGAAMIFVMLVAVIAGLILWERRRARRARDS